MFKLRNDKHTSFVESLKMRGSGYDPSVTDKLLNKMLDVMLMSVRCLLACSCLVQNVKGRPKA